ncbi:UDP-glycosyltransferase 72B1 [Spatholobus suberectus]|nr:UDP-glycosyltransferase 72B1 [Spatholobus suberectus]
MLRSFGPLDYPGLGTTLIEVPNSILYVSFGSGGTLSQNQLNELALGLELSGQKFLWVVRAPSESANSAYLNSHSDDPLRFLPYGFIDRSRTKEQGLVVPSWAPQVQVLGHNATGGFLTHCGWNSTLESIMNGVPLIAWPLFAEQGMNAVTLADGLKVALRPKANENGLVGREGVAKVIRRLIECEEGREIGRRMQKLKNDAAQTLQEEGSSTKTLIQFAVNLIGN